ncbi:MAG: hypothetical protein U0Y10_08960 [Spirosomataceae bacterium]
MSFRQSENQAAFDYYQQRSLYEKKKSPRSLDLSFRQSENQAAFDYYQQALPLYEKIGGLVGQSQLSKKSWGFVISSIGEPSGV